MVDNPLRVLPFGEPAPDDTDATCVSLRNLQHKLLALPLGVGASLGYVGAAGPVPGSAGRQRRVRRVGDGVVAEHGYAHRLLATRLSKLCHRTSRMWRQCLILLMTAACWSCGDETRVSQGSVS